MSRRHVERTLREILAVLGDPLNEIREPEAWVRATEMLRLLFEHVDENAIFVSWIVRNLGERNTKIVRAWYEAWLSDGGRRVAAE